MGSPAIRTEGLSKRYGDTLALDALDLTVAAGEVYGYLGPNGAGKTTTIRLLLGLHRPTGGHAFLFGVDAWRDPVAAHRRVALRRGRAVPLAGADRRGDAHVSRAAARVDGRGVPRRARRALPARHREACPRAVEGEPPEGAARRRVRDARRPAPARRADRRARSVDGGRVPPDRARGEGARPDDLPLVAHPQRGRGALRPRRHPPPRAARRRGDARRAAAPERADDRGDVRGARARAAEARRRPRRAGRCERAPFRGVGQRRPARRGARGAAGRSR